MNQRDEQREKNRKAFEGTGLLEVMAEFDKRFGPIKVLGAVNDETGYAVGVDLGPREED